MSPHRFPARSKELLDNEHRRAVQPAEGIIGRMAPRPQETVADLGCGNGYVTRPLAAMVRTIVAVDVQREMLRALEQAASCTEMSRIHLVQGDIIHPPFADSIFDRMLMVNVVHEVRDKELLDREAHRCLRPGGRLTVVDFHKKETSFGPPVSERLTMDQMLALFPSFTCLREWNAEEFYQLELER